MEGVDMAPALDGQDWRVAWYPPPGTPHGAAAICVTSDHVVLIGNDGEKWASPAGA